MGARTICELDEKRKGTATIDYLFLTRYMMEIDKSEISKKYTEYIQAEKEMNRIKTLKSKKNSGKINDDQLIELKELKKKYDGKKLEDYIDFVEVV